MFQSAAVSILRREDDLAAASHKPPYYRKQFHTGTSLSREDWINGVIRGANDQSPRSLHLLVLAGLLIGFSGQERQGLTPRLRSTIENALTQAVNLAMDHVHTGVDLKSQCIALTMMWTYDVLSQSHRSVIDHDVRYQEFGLILNSN